METSQFDNKKEIEYSKEQPMGVGLGETGKIRQHKRHDILRTLAGSAMVIAAGLANIGCEKKAQEPIYTEGRKIENQKVEEPRPAPAPAPAAPASGFITGEEARRMLRGENVPAPTSRPLTKEERLRMLGGENEAAPAAPVPAAPPARVALTSAEIYAAEKKRQGGDPTAPVVMYSDRSYYYCDESGKNVFGDTYFSSAEPFVDGIALISEPTLYKHYNRETSQVIAYYFINRNGVNAFGERKYLSVSPFVDGVALVQEYGGEYFYFINKNGVKAFDRVFGRAEIFSYGFAKVTDTWTDPKTGETRKMTYFIDKNGVDAFGGKKFEFASSFSDGLALIKSGEKYYYINKNGANAFGNKEFDRAETFKGGYANVVEGIRPYVINKNGEEVRGK